MTMRRWLLRACLERARVMPPWHDLADAIYEGCARCGVYDPQPVFDAVYAANPGLADDLRTVRGDAATEALNKAIG